LNKIGIIGAGRAGTAFGYSLHLSGYKIIAFLEKNEINAKKFMQLTECKNWEKTPSQIFKECDILFFTLPDDLIEKISNEMWENDFINENVFLFHASGALPSSILPGKRRASIHPCISINFERFPENTNFVIEGDEVAIEKAKEIVEKLKGKYYIIDKDKKLLYHSALCFVSPFCYTLLLIGEKILRDLNLPQNLICDLFMSICRNLKEKGIRESMTGPHLRGDVNLIKKEIDELKKKYPQFSEIYRLLTDALFKLK